MSTTKAITTTCPECGATNSGNPRFCSDCGTQISFGVTNNNMVQTAKARESFDLSSFIVSLIITLVIAGSVGIVGAIVLFFLVSFVVGFIVMQIGWRVVVNEPSGRLLENINGYTTIIIYILLFIIVWRALYKVIKGMKSSRS